MVLAACSQKPKDYKAQLADLKNQQADIASKIAKIEAEHPSTDSSKIADVSTVIVKPQPFTNYVQIQGSIDAQDNVTAYPQSPGFSFLIMPRNSGWYFPVLRISTTNERKISLRHSFKQEELRPLFTELAQKGIMIYDHYF